MVWLGGMQVGGWFQMVGKVYRRMVQWLEVEEGVHLCGGGGRVCEEAGGETRRLWTRRKLGGV